jgi:hypothetical protein
VIVEIVKRIGTIALAVGCWFLPGLIGLALGTHATPAGLLVLVGLFGGATWTAVLVGLAMFEVEP